MILGGGLALLEKLLPLPREFDQPTELAVKVLVILALFFFLDRLVLQLLNEFAGRVRTFDLSGGIVQGLVRLTVLGFGLMIILDSVGISITPLVASLGMGSLAVALGLQETLASLFAGLYILAERPVRVGDFIKTFKDSSINFTVILRVKEFTEQYLLKHEFIKALYVRYQKEGIIIPFPTRSLELPARTLEEFGFRKGMA